MSDVARGSKGASEIVVYGARTCEDTAIARSRLGALGVPFREIDIDADEAALARVVALEGRRVTPTIVTGDATTAIAEPSIAQLEALVREAGHRFESPTARQINGSLADRPIPLRTLDRVSNERFSLEELRGRVQSAVFFAHGADCLACQGYAKQLAAQTDPMRAVESAPVVVVRGSVDDARAWSGEMAADVVLVADPDGDWTGAVGAAVGADPSGVMLLVLDRYAAPRAVSVATEAGGLISPHESTEWLQFLGLECPECGNDVVWPET